MKQDMTIEVFANETNFAVLRIPDRQFPGVLIQGDSLAAIIGELKGAVEFFDSDREESLGCLKLGLDQLTWRLDAYNRVCNENGYKGIPMQG